MFYGINIMKDEEHNPDLMQRQVAGRWGHHDGGTWEPGGFCSQSSGSGDPEGQPGDRQGRADTQGEEGAHRYSARSRECPKIETTISQPSNMLE